MLGKIIRWIKLGWKRDELTRMKRKQAFFERRNLLFEAQVNDSLIRKKEQEIERLENEDRKYC